MSLPPDEHREKWIAAITKHAAMVTLVAMELGINRKTVAKYRDEVDWIGEAFAFVHETTLDAAEKCIMEKVKTNPKIAGWYLDRKGRRRGYGKQLNVKQEATARIVIKLPDNGRRLTDDKPPE